MVTFELALAVPLLVLSAFVGCWLVRLGQLQAQAQDAARATAREAARGADEAAAFAAGEQVLPGVRLSTFRSGASITVVAGYDASVGSPLLSPLSRHVEARTTTTLEPQ